MDSRLITENPTGRPLTVVIFVLNLLFFVLGFNVISRQSQSNPSAGAKMYGNQDRYNELINEGFAYLQMSNGNILVIAKGLQSFEAAIEENPRNLNGYMNLGRVYMKLNSFDFAIKTFESALIIFPEEGLLNYLLAECYFAVHDNALARHFAKRSMKNFQDNNNVKDYLNAKVLLERISLIEQRHEKK